MNEGVIELDQFLPQPPEVVWEALTDPDQLATWFAPNDIAPVVGHRFPFDMDHWGTTHCEVTAAEPPRLLRHTFGGGALDTEVTWRLEREGNGTRLFLEHRGFDLDTRPGRQAHDGMGQGWRSQVVPALAQHVSR